MHPSRPIRGASDQRLPTRGGMRWPECRVWRCAPRLRRSKPQQSRRDQRSRHRVLWRQRRNSVPNGQALSRPKAVVRKLRPPGALRSKPQTPRAGRRRFGGLAVRFDRWAVVFSGIAAPLRRREMPQPAGPTDPGVPRALGLCSPRAHRPKSLGRKTAPRERWRLGEMQM